MEAGVDVTGEGNGAMKGWVVRGGCKYPVRDERVSELGVRAQCGHGHAVLTPVHAVCLRQRHCSW